MHNKAPCDGVLKFVKQMLILINLSKKEKKINNWSTTGLNLCFNESAKIDFEDLKTQEQYGMKLKLQEQYGTKTLNI